MPLTEPAGVYRPRHPERTVVYRLFEEHFERYVREYKDRYEAREGSLRKVVTTTVEAYLACGRLEGGFARARLLLPDPQLLPELPGEALGTVRGTRRH